jgi:hypothetical protein
MYQPVDNVKLKRFGQPEDEIAAEVVVKGNVRK